MGSRRLFIAASIAISLTLANPLKLSAAASDVSQNALLIANATYADGDSELATPVGDAERLAESLKLAGFRLQIERNLSKGKMEDAIERFAQGAEQDATAVFFFAGYGVQAGGKNYLIPIDPGPIWGEADLTREAIAVDDVEAKLAKRGVRTRVIILDAARRNPFERRFRKVAAGLAATPPSPGVVRLFSTANSVVPDRPGERGTQFVAVLSKAIARDGSHIVKALQACRDEIAMGAHKDQVPYLISGLQEASPVNSDSRYPEKPVASEEGRDTLPESPAKPLNGDDKRAEVETIRRYSATNAARKAELDARIARDSLDEAAISERGQLLAMHRDYNAAISDFNASIRLNPDNVLSWNNRCWVRAIVNQLPLALEDCNEALLRRPGFVDALDSRGLVNLKRGDMQAALADYNAALKIDPRHASALYGRGIAYRKLGQLEESSADMQKAETLNPEVAREFQGYHLD